LLARVLEYDPGFGSKHNITSFSDYHLYAKYEVIFYHISFVCLPGRGKWFGFPTAIYFCDEICPYACSPTKLKQVHDHPFNVAIIPYRCYNKTRKPETF
jgi:hypothetical protein